MFQKFARFYNHILNRYTYPVQMVTAGTLWFSGDILCQSLVWYSSTDSNDLSYSSIHHGSKSAPFTEKNNNSQREQTIFINEIDWRRTLRMTLYGTFFSAPIYTCWFTLLEKLSMRTFKSYSNNVISSKLLQQPTHSSSAKISHATSRLWKITAYKTVLDVIVFDPFYLSFFFIISGCMENKSLTDIKQKLRDELSTTFAADVAVWLPIQFANFRYIPVLYQPLIVQGVNLFWNTFLSWVQHKEARIMPPPPSPTISPSI